MTDVFNLIPSNPLPEKATGGYFAGFDGKKLRYGRFPAVARPLKGTVIVLSGRNECIEKYFETARNLSERGFTTATFDWRGQGDSERLLRDRQRGHVRDFSDYVKDLDRFFEEVVLPDCRGPYYVLGHSTGSLIALLATPSLINRVRRMVLVAPFFTYTGFPLSIRARAARRPLPPTSSPPISAATAATWNSTKNSRSWGSAARPLPGSAPPAGQSRSYRTRNSSLGSTSR
jgi:lysophospholipase